MEIYTNNARGIQLDSRHTKVNLENINTDFVVAMGGIGDEIDPMFTKHIQTAYDKNIPLIMKWNIKPEYYVMADFNKWKPAPEDEYHLKAMKQAIYYSYPNGKRAVHGIMLDITDNIQSSTGRTITQSWIASIASFIYDNAWSMFKLPMFVYMNQSILDAYGSCPELDQFLSTTNAICSWKSANPGASTSNISDGILPIPTDSYKPQYVSNASKVWFTKYSNTAYTITGITNSSDVLQQVPLWQYLSTPAGLYSDLGFTKNTVEEPVIEDPVIEEPETPEVEEPVETTEKHYCSHCGGYTYDDQYGNCSACGAPRAISTNTDISALEDKIDELAQNVNELKSQSNIIVTLINYIKELLDRIFK